MPDSVHVHFGSGKVTGLEIVPSFAIGNASGKNLQLLRLENAAGPGDVVGILGMDVLSNFDVEIDVAHGTANLFTHDHCEGKVVYWPNDGYAEIPYRTDPAGDPIFEMQLDGKPVTVALTVRAGSARMPMAAARRVFGIDENSPGLTVLSEPAAQHKQYRLPFKTLSIAGVTIRNPAITLYGSSTDKECRPDLKLAAGGDLLEKCFGGYDLTLGAQELRALHIYMATKEKKLYVTAAKPPAGEPKKISP